MEPRRNSALNENQQRRLIVTCQHVDPLLADLQRSFIEAQSSSPFGRYANDLAPAEQRLVTDYIARIRTQLLRMLEGQETTSGLSGPPRRTPSGGPRPPAGTLRTDARRSRRDRKRPAASGADEC